MKTKLLVFSIAILVILTRIPISIDYQHFMIATRGWLAGITPLYDIQAGEFYYFPWALWITVPLSVLPDWLGQAVLNLVSLASIAWVCRLWAGELKAWQWMLVFVNLFTINLLFTAQWDGLTLLGIGLAWWALQKRRPWLFGSGLMLAATKPVSILIVILVLFGYGIKNLSRKEIFQSALMPAILLGWSVWSSGVDWPLRYMKYITENPPPPAYNISLWGEISNDLVLTGLLILLSTFIVAWIFYLIKRGDSLDVVFFALTANLILSPYVLSYHFILTSPALAWISKRNWLFSLVIYGLMLWFFFGIAQILPLPPFVLYPILILGALVLLIVIPRWNKSKLILVDS